MMKPARTTTTDKPPLIPILARVGRYCMRAVLLLVASMTVLYAYAGAQTDGIGLYVDTGYSDCTIVDDGPGQVNVYVVHHTSFGATASQFMVKPSSGAMLTHMGDTYAFELVIGSTQSGVAVSYEECLYGDILVVTSSYYKSGSSSPCSYLLVAPDPASASGTIKATGCYENTVEMGGTRLVINPDGSCACGPTSEVTNWGKIKERFK
jgi:hypothetical protein